MVVGELALARRGLEETVGIQADAGDLREPMRQHGEVGVPVGGGREFVEQRRPFGDGGGEVVDDAPVEAGLPAGLDGRELPFAGGPGIGGWRAVRGAPHGEVGDSGGVRAEAARRRPRRESGGRQRLVAHLVGEFDDERVDDEDDRIDHHVDDQAGVHVGHVDIGDLGVADRWADLAIATMSLDWNFPGNYEAALLDALNSGKVKAAGLDVWLSEKDPNWALASHPAVSCTPHIGAGTKEAQKRIGAELVDIVENFG